MINDDLSGLFAPPPNGPALPALWRMGRLVSFSADDGSNSVLIDQTTIDNMPLAVTGAEIGLETGDNVLIMYLGTTAMIFAKIATPGSANYGASNGGRAGFVDNISNWATSLAGTVVISDQTILVPGWAHSAQVTMLGSASTHNSQASGSFDNISSQVRVACPGQSDGFSATIPQAVGGTLIGSTFANYTDVLDVTPGQLLTFTYTIFTSTVAWTARSDNIATLFVSCEFFRESV